MKEETHRLNPLLRLTIGINEPLLDVRSKEPGQIEVSITPIWFMSVDRRVHTQYSYSGQKALYIPRITFDRRYKEKMSCIGISGVGPFLESSIKRLLALSKSCRYNGTTTSTYSATISKCLSNGNERCVVEPYEATHPKTGSGKRLSNSFADFSISSVISRSGNALLTPGAACNSRFFSSYHLPDTDRICCCTSVIRAETSTSKRSSRPLSRTISRICM